VAYFPGTQSFRQPYPLNRTKQGGDNRRAVTANGLPNVMARGLPVPGRAAGNRKEQPPGWSQGNAWWKQQGMTPQTKQRGTGRPSPQEMLDLGATYPGRDSGRPIMQPVLRQPQPYFPPGQTPPWGGPVVGGYPGRFGPSIGPRGGGYPQSKQPGPLPDGGILDLITRLLGGGGGFLGL